LHPLNDYELKNNGSSYYYFICSQMWPAQEKNKTCKLELLDFQFIIPIKVVMQWNT